MKVFIIESNYPKDFYAGRLDGVITAQLLGLLGATTKLKYALDLVHFKKSIKEASRGGYDVLHISCHGGDDGIALSNNEQLDWTQFAACLQEHGSCPKALVMSSCCGASTGVGTAFSRVTVKPNIIFGSTDERSFDEYAVAWAILYKEFRDGVSREAAQSALKKICSSVHGEFRYRRWSDDEEKYLIFPKTGRTYNIEEY
jgi:hypothetical protein